MESNRENAAGAHAITTEEVRFAVDVAAGRRPATVLLHDARLLNVFDGRIRRVSVALAGRLIATVGPGEDAPAADVVVDLRGAYLAPGLIDGHVHIESSLVTPGAYAEGVVPRGVTGVVCDPHEIANVAGVAGVEWLLERSPPWETAGATLGLAEIEALLQHPEVVGVAEMMSFPAVVAGDDAELNKVALAEAARKTAEGHAPALSGRALQAYLASGIASDHESTTLEEGLEKLAAGVFLMVREGSVTRDLDALLPLVRPEHADRVGFVTDDRLPHDLLDEGGVDCLVRRAVQSGADPVYAVRCASYNVARHYGLARRGAVAPGYVADLVVLDDLPSFRAHAVYKAGHRVAVDGRLEGAPAPAAARTAARGEASMRPAAPAPDRHAAAVTGTVRLPPLEAAALRLEGGGAAVRVIQAIPNQILTRSLDLPPTVRDGEVVADPGRDLLKLACVERHGRTGGVAVGLVTGFGLQEGALASTVGHDHHNLLAVGVDDGDMIVAAQRLQALGGGFVAVREGRVLAELPLEIAGLVTDAPLAEVRARMRALDEAAARLGATLPSPFMALSFLGLPVIPELRLTDLGLVDVLAGRLVPFAAEG
ncbi:MAG: adenine deaminase [Deinococcales bacterium]